MRECDGLGRSGGDRLSRVLRHSTIGAGAVNGRVRDGIGFETPRSDHQTGQARRVRASILHRVCVWFMCPIRTRIMRAIKPIERLVLVSSARYRACTSSLSTWSSSTALEGVLVSRGVSRLDAFSGYPTEHSYPALRLAPQQVHQRFVHPGPLVLGTDPLRTPTPRQIGTELSHDVLNPAHVPL